MTTVVAATWIGPRSVGRLCAAWWPWFARNRFACVLVMASAALVAAEAALVVTVLCLNAAAQRDSVPAIFTPSPAYFCPAGQHVTGVDATGWPACAPDH